MAQRLAAGPEGPAVWGTRGDALLRHRDDVHAVARRVLADAGLAEDVVQETLARALQHEDTVEPERAGAWLTVVGRRLAVDTSRGRRRTDLVDEHDDRPSVADDPAELAERRHLLAQVAEAFDQLSPRQRRLLLRQLDSGLSLAQLAEEERTTVASVRSVLARAREVLRANLHHTGWLVAGLLPRLLTAVRSPATRLLSRIETAAPFTPQVRHDLAEVVAAGAAAVALLFSAVGGSGEGGGDGSHPQAVSSAVAPSTGSSTVPDPSVADADALGLDLALPGLGPDEDLSDILWWELPPEREHIEIPFQDFGGDVNQFAVSPDGKTILAVGGWVETAASAHDEAFVKEWTPLFFRSNDGGHTWMRHEVPGFLPGAVLFAPLWPADRRVFVVTDDKAVLQSDDGGWTFKVLQQASSISPPPPPPADHEHPERTVTWAEDSTPDPSDVSDPKTVVRKQQLAPRTLPVRPALIATTEREDLIYIGGEGAGVFHVTARAFEPFVAVPPWQSSNGIALAPDHAETGAVLVGAVPQNPNGPARGGVYRCVDRLCELQREFDDMGNAPGVFISGDLVYAWTPYTAYRSADGGATWTRQVLGPVLDVIEVGRRLVAVSMSGVPVSDDRGASWRQLPFVYSLWAAAVVDNRHLLVASGPGVACSPDGGDHWRPNCPLD